MANTQTLGTPSNGRIEPPEFPELSRSAVQLLEAVRRYLPLDQVEFVWSALQFAAEAHAGQTRKSGEPFIEHPIHTALRLAEMRLPSDVIAAALLHDTLEDCDTDIDELQRRFGDAVARMVDGVTKLTQIDLLMLDAAPVRTKRRHADQRERQRIHSLRKMLVTAGEDRRVLLIKLADRMHNMETLGFLNPDQQRRIASETMDIYAPIADRLGMNDMKWKLEDAAFHYLNPRDYKTISRLVNRTRKEREQFTQLAVKQLENEVIGRHGLKASITGRAKHLFSIHKKKQRYEELGRTFDEIHDLIALRVITENEQDCYNALGIVHGLWPMITGTFDDYISKSKPNGYRSLHTTVWGPGSTPLEVQIRSKSMHVYAEEGVAAHWAYKDGAATSGYADYFNHTMTWLKDVIEMDGVSSGAEDFMDSVETEILQSDQVQVFTPAGDVINLPRGATPLDFAYRIHTDLGHSTVGAVVNGKLVTLNTRLESGDIVEIRKARVPRGPSLDWQDDQKRYLVTGSARAKVRQWFGRQARETNMQEGRKQLKRVIDQLRRMGHDVSAEVVAEYMSYSNVDELVADLGKTNEQSSTIVRTVVKAISDSRVDKVVEEQLEAGEREVRRRKGRDLSKGVVVMGQTGMQVNFPKCCTPVYGDEITGYLTRGRGVTAHRSNCRNLRNTKDPDRLVEVAWGHVDDTYPAKLRVGGSDRIGLIHDLCGVIRSEKMNLHGISSGEDIESGKTTVAFTVYTTGVEQLAHLFSQLESVPGVDSVFRIR